MRSRPLLLAMSLTVAIATVASAQEMVPKIEYQGGHAGMDQKVKGSLLISDTDVQFTDPKGKQLIDIPLAQIRDVSSTIDRKDASVGAKLAIGFLAKSRKDELVTISFETEKTAEGVVFKTDKNMSAGLVAKIRFHLKKAGLAAAPDSLGQQTVPHAPGALGPGTPSQH